MALPIVCQANKLRGAAVALLLCAASAIGCARTGLYPGELGDGEPATGGASNGGASNVATGGAGTSNAGTPSVAGVAGVAIAGAPTTANEMPPRCQPSPEVCNGVDDDCNGAVDDLPATPCSGGGFQFCVAGKLSECPRRCDVCVPGSVRVCENGFCSFWGEQECAADGQGFGNCQEADPPPECKDIAKKFQKSRELEQCCIDNGYCCLDDQDLDGDGDRREMLGACGDIACQ